MIAVLRQGVTKQQRDGLIEWFEHMGLNVHVSEGEYQCILGLIGDTSKVDINLLESLSIVESVKRISEPFKNANRKFHTEDSVIEVEDRDGGCPQRRPEPLRYNRLRHRALCRIQGRRMGRLGRPYGRSAGFCNGGRA